MHPLATRTKSKIRRRSRRAVRVMVGWALMFGLALGGFAQADLNKAPAEETMGEGDYERLIREAAECVVASDWNPAFKALNRAIEMDPDRPEAYFTYGRAHQLREEFAAAERAYRQLLEIDPNLSKAWYALAKLMGIKGELKRALDYTRNAIDDADPKDWRQFTFLGELYAEMGLKESALEAFDDTETLLRAQIDPLQRTLTNIAGEVDVYLISQVTEFVPNMVSRSIDAVPAVRYQYQSRIPPEELVNRLRRLEAELAAVKERKAEVLAWMESD